MKSSGKILIIDDNDENRYTFGRYLKKGGFEVSEAATVTDGLKLAQQNPDLIILDVQLPDMNGFEACRHLKTSPATASIPVLHTSATFRKSSDRTQGLAGGADGYLIQPIDPEELLATVHALLRIRKAEARAKKLAEEWKTTFEAVSDGICLLDSKGTIQRFNPALSQVFGETQLESASLPTLLKKQHLDPARLQDSLSSGKKVSETLKIGELFFQFTVNPVDAGIGPEAGFAAVFSDITAIRRAEELLKNHNEELEQRVRERTAALNEANAQLESFCYSVAHDLRAPIRTMQGFSDVLMEDYSAQLEPDALNYLGRINKGAKKMDRLIQDLLRYSRLSQDKIVFEKVNLLDCVNSILNDSEKELSKNQEAFTVDIPKDLRVPAHPTTLQQAIWNLLSNAVKFMPEDREPKIRISTEQKGSMVKLLIRDNGIGIAPEHHGKIFDMFERIDSNSYSGTGIGLAIVKRAMERMGGRVGLSSKPGEGSTFWLEFNLDHGEAPDS